MIYLIGSLRNPEVPKIAEQLRAEGFEVFDDWYAAGPTADDCWRDYEKARNRDFIAALGGHAARHVFAFDREHLERASEVVLVLPAGKSGHLELGYALGRGKNGYVLVDNPERWDVMYQFCTGIYTNLEELIDELKNLRERTVDSQRLGTSGIRIPSETGLQDYPRVVGSGRRSGGSGTSQGTPETGAQGLLRSLKCRLDIPPQLIEE